VALSESAEAGEIDRRKEIVLKESGAVKDAIQSLQSDLRRKVSQLEVEYQIQRQLLGNGVEDAARRQRRLIANVDQQKMRIQQAQQTYISRATEAIQLEEAIPGEIQQFERQLKDEMQAGFSFAHQQAIDLANQLACVQGALSKELEELVAQLEAAQATAKRVADRLLLERAQAIEEIGTTLTVAAEESRNVTNARFIERMEALEVQFIDDRQANDESMLERKGKQKRRLEALCEERSARIEELEAEKVALTEEQMELDEAIELMSHRECPESRQLLTNSHIV
jgi:hypothetical protein